jgi:hypothetical protein
MRTRPRASVCDLDALVSAKSQDAAALIRAPRRPLTSILQHRNTCPVQGMIFTSSGKKLSLITFDVNRAIPEPAAWRLCENAC